MSVKYITYIFLHDTRNYGLQTVGMAFAMDACAKRLVQVCPSGQSPDTFMRHPNIVSSVTRRPSRSYDNLVATSSVQMLLLLVSSICTQNRCCICQ